MPADIIRLIPFAPQAGAAPAEPSDGTRKRSEIVQTAINVASPEPLLLPAPKAARLCGISEATWYRLKAAGKVPVPVRLGGRVLWKVEELRRWCAAGCPDQRSWLALEHANGRSRLAGR